MERTTIGLPPAFIKPLGISDIYAKQIYHPGVLNSCSNLLILSADLVMGYISSNLKGKQGMHKEID